MSATRPRINILSGLRLLNTHSSGVWHKQKLNARPLTRGTGSGMAECEVSAVIFSNLMLRVTVHKGVLAEVDGK